MHFIKIWVVNNSYRLLLRSSEQGFVKLVGDSDALVFQFFVVDVFRFGVDEVLHVVNLVFALLEFLLSCRVWGKLVMHLILLLCHVYLVIRCRQGCRQLLFYLAQLLLLLAEGAFLLYKLLFELLYSLEFVRYLLTHLLDVCFQVLYLLSCSNLGIF